MEKLSFKLDDLIFMHTNDYGVLFGMDYIFRIGVLVFWVHFKEGRVTSVNPTTRMELRHLKVEEWEDVVVTNEELEVHANDAKILMADYNAQLVEKIEILNRIINSN